MNLYVIKFSHYAPKDEEQGIKALLLAQNEEQVYNWISSAPKLKFGTMFNSWFENEDDEDCQDDDETFKEKILRLKGDIEDDTVDFSNSYYGITLYGWELLKENITTDYTELIQLGIVFVAE